MKASASACRSILRPHAGSGERRLIDDSLHVPLNAVNGFLEGLLWLFEYPCSAASAGHHAARDFSDLNEHTSAGGGVQFDQVRYSRHPPEGIETNMALTAVLTGTFRVPELSFEFPWGARMPKGGDVQEWIKKKCPGRRFDRSEKTWYITGTAIHPDCFFEHYGIEVDFSEAEGDLAGLASLESLWRHLRPPAAGFDKMSTILGPMAVWDKTRQRFDVMLSDLIDENGDPKKGLKLEPATTGTRPSHWQGTDDQGVQQIVAQQGLLAASRCVERSGGRSN
jgi:hypothetical protein